MLIRLAKAQNAAGDRASALDTFARANRLAATVPNEHLRRLAVMRTAVARGRIGDRDAAHATLERFILEGEQLGPAARFSLMTMVCDFLFQAGFKDEARAALDKALALVALARAQGKAGDRAAAAATPGEAVGHARDILARENMINDDPGANADRVFREIVACLVETGDTAGAIAIVAGRGSDAWKSEDLGVIAPIRARLGDIPGSLATAKSILDPTLSAEAYAAIASIQAQAGDPLAALSWSSELKAPVAKAFALIGITEALAAHKAKTREHEARKP